MQTDLFPAINEDIRDFHSKLNAKINDLQTEIQYLERLRDLVVAALLRDTVAELDTSTLPTSPTPGPVTDELESGMRKIALKLAPEKR